MAGPSELLAKCSVAFSFARNDKNGHFAVTFCAERTFRWSFLSVYSVVLFLKGKIRSRFEVFRTNSVRLNFFSLCVFFSKEMQKGVFLISKASVRLWIWFFLPFSSSLHTLPRYPFRASLKSHVSLSLFFSPSISSASSFQLLYFGKRQNCYLRRA